LGGDQDGPQSKREAHLFPPKNCGDPRGSRDDRPLVCLKKNSSCRATLAKSFKKKDSGKGLRGALNLTRTACRATGTEEPQGEAVPDHDANDPETAEVGRGGGGRGEEMGGDSHPSVKRVVTGLLSQVTEPERPP